MLPLPQPRRVRRAASMIYQFTKVKQALDRETLPPHVLRDIVPICMDQYHHVFSLTRIPGRDTDTLRKWDQAESRHIAVLYRGVWYRVHMFSAEGKPLSLYQIQSILQGIVDAGAHATGPERSPGLHPPAKRVTSLPDLDDLQTRTATPEPLPPPAELLAALTTDNRSTWAAVREEVLHCTPGRLPPPHPGPCFGSSEL